MQNTKMGRTPCCAKAGLNRGPWSREEDDLLTKYIQSFGEGSWRTLPKKAGLQRCGKSCRLRWMNYLRPDVKRGYISPEEEDLILRLHRLLGNRWSLIAGRIPGRTDNEIKNYWNTHLSKQLISQGIDPRTHKPLPELSHQQRSYSTEDSDHPNQRSPKQETLDCEFRTAGPSRSNSLEVSQEIAIVAAFSKDRITNNFHVQTDPKFMESASDFLRNSTTPNPHLANSVLKCFEVDTNWKSQYTSMNFSGKTSVFDTSFMFPDQYPSVFPLMPLNVDFSVTGGSQHISSTSLHTYPRAMDPLQSAGPGGHSASASHWNMTTGTTLNSVTSFDMASSMTACASQRTPFSGGSYDFTIHNYPPVLPIAGTVSHGNMVSANPTLGTNFPAAHKEGLTLADPNFMFPTSGYLCPITPIPVNKSGDEDPSNSDIVFSSFLQSFVHPEALFLDYNTPTLHNKQLLCCLNPHESRSHTYNNEL